MVEISDVTGVLAYDPTTSILTPHLKGVYLVNINVFVEAQIEDSIVTLYLVRNGDFDILYINLFEKQATSTISGTKLVQLSKGDRLSVAISSNRNVIVKAGSHFSVVRVRQ